MNKGRGMAREKGGDSEELDSFMGYVLDAEMRE